MVNVKQASVTNFHSWISQFVEEVEDVNVATWPIHHRWRIINACLGSGLLRLAEVPEGYLLEVVDVPEVEAEVPEHHTPDDAA